MSSPRLLPRSSTRKSSAELYGPTIAPGRARRMMALATAIDDRAVVVSIVTVLARPRFLTVTFSIFYRRRRRLGTAHRARLGALWKACVSVARARWWRASQCPRRALRCPSRHVRLARRLG